MIISSIQIEKKQKGDLNHGPTSIEWICAQFL